MQLPKNISTLLYNAPAISLTPNELKHQLRLHLPNQDLLVIEFKDNNDMYYFIDILDATYIWRDIPMADWTIVKKRVEAIEIFIDLLKRMDGWLNYEVKGGLLKNAQPN